MVKLAAFAFVRVWGGRPRPPIYGITTNCLLLVSVPVEVVTVTNPVVAPLGTIIRLGGWLPISANLRTASGLPAIREKFRANSERL